MAKYIVLGLALLFILATVLSVIRTDAWFVRVFDFPRLQITLGGIIILIVYFLVWDHSRYVDALILGVLFLSVSYQLYRILPYTAIYPLEVLDADEVNGGPTLSLLTVNVLMTNRNVDDFLEVVRSFDPDVLLAVETDEFWAEALRELHEEYPHRLEQPQDDTYGMLLFSRLELVEPEIRFLLEENVPSMHARVQLPAGRQVWLHCLHPHPPNPTYATETTERDAELLIVGREVSDHREPAIVIGDLNDVAWSNTTRLFQKVSGLLDPRIGRGTFSTFHAKYPLMRWPLDHVFHSEHFKLISLERGREFGSDHLPVFISLATDADGPMEQEAPVLEPEEKKEADEKIRDARQEDGREDPHRETASVATRRSPP